MTSIIIGITTYTCVSATLIFSFIGIRKVMLEYHEDKYDCVKVFLWLYFIFDLLGYVILILSDIFVALGIDVTDGHYIWDVVLLVFPSI